MISADNAVGLTTTFNDGIADVEGEKWDLGGIPYTLEHFEAYYDVHT